jgi:hypothetical protein
MVQVKPTAGRNPPRLFAGVSRYKVRAATPTMAMMTVSNGRCLTGVAAPEDWEVGEGEDAVDVGGRRGVASGTLGE